MKKLVLSMFAVAALASCVQNETINPGSAIDFGAPFVGNTTKAADPSYGQDAVELKEFYVYGTVQGTGAGVVNIFNGAEVTGEIGTQVWTCGVTQYWIQGATYNFAAVVDATVTPDANKMPATLAPVTHTVADDAKHYVVGQLKDLLYAQPATILNAAPQANDTYAPVNFEFGHLLSKAHFTVTSNTKDGYYYNVKDIKIHNFATGEYTIDTQKWNKETATTDHAYELGDILNVTAANTNQTNATQVLLIPTTTDFQVECIVELLNNNGTDDVADDVLLREIHYTAADVANCGCTNANAEHNAPFTVSTDLVKGHAYNFTLALTTGAKIEFTVTANPDWEGTTELQ
jgi:hypothetical protein